MYFVTGYVVLAMLRRFGQVREDEVLDILFNTAPMAVGLIANSSRDEAEDEFRTVIGEILKAAIVKGEIDSGKLKECVEVLTEADRPIGIRLRKEEKEEEKGGKKEEEKGFNCNDITDKINNIIEEKLEEWDKTLNESCRRGTALCYHLKLIKELLNLMDINKEKQNTIKQGLEQPPLPTR